jgi:hypothetical protein
MIINPEGRILWEAGKEEAIYTQTLDLDLVRKSREYGTLFMDHYLKHLRDNNYPTPFAGRIAEAPVFQTLGPAPQNNQEHNKKVLELGIGAFNVTPPEEDHTSVMDKYAFNLTQFLTDAQKKNQPLKDCFG